MGVHRKKIVFRKTTQKKNEKNILKRALRPTKKREERRDDNLNAVIDPRVLYCATWSMAQAQERALKARTLACLISACKGRYRYSHKTTLLDGLLCIGGFRWIRFSRWITIKKIVNFSAVTADNFWTVTWGACRMQQIGKVLTRLFFDQKKALQSLGFQPKIFCLVSMSMAEEIVIWNQ